MSTAPLVYALGWSLIHSLWQGALLCALAYAIVPLFQLSAKDKANLLFSLLLTLLLAFFGTFSYYLPVGGSEQSMAYLPVFGELKQLELTFVQKSFSLALYFPYIAWAYAVGFGLQLLVLLMGYQRIWQLKRGDKQLIPDAWQHTFERLLREMRINQRARCFISEKVQIPMVIGFLKPVILFPIAAVSTLDMAQVETILIHEMNHIKRNDYLINIIKSLIETVLFFNPFVWVLGRMLAREREHACDDQVLTLTGNAIVYARALLALESTRSKQLPAFALGAFTRKQYLLDRIKRMTIMKTATLHARHKLAAISLLIAGFVGLAWINPAQDTLPQPPKPANVPKMLAEMPPAPPKPPAMPLAEHPVAPLAPLRPVQEPDTFRAKSDTAKKAKTIAAHKTDQALESFFSSKEWQDYQAELQKNAQEVRIEAEKIQSHFNSPEWKAYQEELAKNAAEIAANSRGITAFFNSPEWKASVKEMQEQATQMGLSAVRHDSAYFASPEWKAKEMAMKQKSKKLEALTKQFDQKFNTLETKAKREALEKKAETLRKQGELLQKQLETPEFKAKQEALRKKGEELARRAQALTGKMDSLRIR